MAISLITICLIGNILLVDDIVEWETQGVKFKISSLYLIIVLSISCVYFLIIHAIDVIADIAIWKNNMTIASQAENSPQQYSALLTRESIEKSKFLQEKTVSNNNLVLSKLEEIRSRVPQELNLEMDVMQQFAYTDALWKEFDIYADQKRKENDELLNDLKIFHSEVDAHTHNLKILLRYTRVYKLRLWFEAIFPIFCGIGALGYSIQYFQKIIY